MNYISLGTNRIIETVCVFRTISIIQQTFIYVQTFLKQNTISSAECDI